MKKLMTRADTSVKVLVPELKRESDFGRVKSYRLSQVRSPQLCDGARYLHLSSDRFLTLTLRSDATAEPLDARIRRQDHRLAPARRCARRVVPHRLPGLVL